MGRNLGFSESLGDTATEWKGPAVFSCSFASADSTYQLCELGRGSSPSMGLVVITPYRIEAVG